MPIFFLLFIVSFSVIGDSIVYVAITKPFMPKEGKLEITTLPIV